MSTIATDGQTVASDSQMTSGDNRVVGLNHTKLHRGKGYIVGFCGFPVQQPLFEKFIETGEKPDGLDMKDCTGLVVKADGIFIYEFVLLPLKMQPPFTMGSGEATAYGAMKAGATPLEAIKIACEVDVYSGGAITSYTVDEVGQ